MSEQNLLSASVLNCHDNEDASPITRKAPGRQGPGLGAATNQNLVGGLDSETRSVTQSSQ